MPDSVSATTWPYYHFGILVTGIGEEQFAAKLFRPLTRAGNCHFEVIARIPQLRPITSPKRILKMVGTGQKLTTLDENIGLKARRYLASHATSFVILVDDLEHEWRERTQAVYDRYRAALDTMLGRERRRAAVHFFVFMLEAYYFANTAAMNSILGTALLDHDGDVEEIRQPKSDIKAVAAHFDEVADGDRIVEMLDLAHVLRRPETCRALRTLIAWCARAMTQTFTDEFQLSNGTFHDVTLPQIRALDEC